MIDLEEKARHIRELILTALAEAGSGHTGGSLDLVETRNALIGKTATKWCFPSGIRHLCFMRPWRRLVISLKRKC